jgi:hypothetical protein
MERVVRLGVLALVFVRLDVAFLGVTLFVRVEAVRGFAVVLRLVWVMILS